MNIHFICLGNTFRSRLAEAYFNSLRIKNLKATSSGVEASKDLNGAITWYGQRILFKQILIKFTPKTWQETNPNIINNCTYLIFMSSHVYDLYKNKLMLS